MRNRRKSQGFGPPGVWLTKWLSLSNVGAKARNFLPKAYERLYFVPYEKICSKTAACKLFRPSLFRRSLAAIFSLTRNFVRRRRDRFRQKIVEIGAILAIFLCGNHTLFLLGATHCFVGQPHIVLFGNHRCLVWEPHIVLFGNRRLMIR